ncbi:MAG: inner membrane protein YpjD [Gammaproteobacteria bacterium]
MIFNELPLWIMPEIAICAYLWVGGKQLANIKQQRADSRWLLLITLIALMAHALFLYQQIDVGHGGSQNLSLVNLISQVLWIMVCFVVVGNLLGAFVNLGMIVYPLAAVSIIVAWFIPGRMIIDSAGQPKQLWHILLSLLAFSVIAMATLHSLVYAIQDILLRRHRAGVWLQWLPPLQTMEQLLFQLIVLGFVLLTIVLSSSLWLFADALSSEMLSKAIFTLLSWLVFAILLGGRYGYGWRGQVAIRWTLLGMLLLTLAFLAIWIRG